MAVNGVLYNGLATLGGGAILSGLIIGAIAVFLLDHKSKMAAAYALAGAVLSYFGFIHGSQVGVGVSPTVALGYLLMSALCFGFSYLPYEATGTSEVDKPLEIPLMQGEFKSTPQEEKTI
jgi:adenine/guanine/hypoxanthine permease